MEDFCRAALSALVETSSGHTQACKSAPPKIWLGSIFSGVRLRLQLCELFSNVVRIAVLRINLEDAFQVLLG